MSTLTRQLEGSLALVPAQPPAVTDDQLDLIKRTVAKGATPDELKLYFYDCARRNVHPLDKLIYFTKRESNGEYKYTPITSIDFMRSQAADSGDYAGNDDAVFEGTTEDGKYPAMATVTVWRITQGQRCPYTASARWKQYYPGEKMGFMWRKMPEVMLAKCAEALALRKAFPKQLAGLYSSEEMAQAPEQTFDKDAYVTAKVAELKGEPTPESAAKAGGNDPIVFDRWVHDDGKTGEAQMLVRKVRDARTKSSVAAKNDKPYVWVEYGDEQGQALTCFDTALFDELKASIGSTINVQFRVGTKGDTITKIVAEQPMLPDTAITPDNPDVPF